MVPVSPFSWHHLNQWHVSWVPLLLLGAAAALYWLGVQRTDAWPRYRSICFAVGLILTFLVTESVIGVYDMTLFSDHMIEHLGLIMVAAPLFAVAAPIELAVQSGSVRLCRALSSRVAQMAFHPLVAFALYAVFIPATHLTGLFDTMLRHEWVHHSEQIAFLIVGYLFFRHAFGANGRDSINPGLRLVYVMAAVPVDTFTGLALAMETRNPFPQYRAMMPNASPHYILDNVHLGGAIMWIGGDALMLLALIPVAVSWVRAETVRTRELDRQLDAAGL